MNATPCEVLTSLYFGLWPTLTVLYHRQDVSYANLLTVEAKETLKNLRSGYLHWVLANVETRKHQGEIQTLIDKMSSTQKTKHLLACPLYKNENIVHLTFTYSMDHPKIAEET